MIESRDTTIVEAGSAWSLRGREVPTRRTRGREMKVKIIPIMLLLLISVAAPVAVSMAIPKESQEFYVKAVMTSHDLEDFAGAQKYTQSGVLYDIGDKEVGIIDLDILITNGNKFLDGGTARARVYFTMTFYDEQVITRVITGIIVGKTSLDIPTWTQTVEGIFVGRGSHVKGTVSMPEINVLLFEGKEW